MNLIRLEAEIVGNGSWTADDLSAILCRSKEVIAVMRMETRLLEGLKVEMKTSLYPDKDQLELTKSMAGKDFRVFQRDVRDVQFMIKINYEI